jgi:dTDP-4-dehydrorhamnose reductase
VLVAHQLEAFERKRLDISSLDEVRSAVEAIRPELVINAAAWNNVDGAESDSAGAYRCNALGPRNLAIATAARGIGLIHVSTDYVFDGERDDPYHEYDVTNPLSVYGKSKLAGEEAVRTLNERHYIVRTALLYHEVGSNFPNRMLEQRDREQVHAVEDQFGSPTYAPHLAEGISRLMGTGAYGTYHLAGRGGASILEWTRTLFRMMKVNAAIVPAKMSDFTRPAARPRNSILTTIQQPEILLPPWEDGLAEFVRQKQHGS